MSKAEPMIQKFMTCQPHAVEAAETVQNAAKMMSDLKIRHLPVMENGKVSGIISDRDIKMALALIDANPRLLIVKDISHEKPYIVDPETRLEDVAREMADKSYGSAIIVQNNKLVGIFTTVDACRALAAVLEVRYH